MAQTINNLAEFFQCGETIAARDAIYIDSTDGKVYKLDVTDETKRSYGGIAKDGGDVDDWVRVIQAGKIKGFTGLIPGQAVYASNVTAGGFTTDKPTNVAETVILGTAKNATDLIVNASLSVPFASGDGSGGGVGGVDILAVQDFNAQDLGEFTQVGLTFETVAPLKGEASAKLVHDDTINQSFKQVIPVDRKFRGKGVSLKLDIKSAASEGNVTLTVVDETNAVTLVNSEQLPVSDVVGGTVGIVSFLVPDNCESLSYEVVALPEAGLPETLVDDVILEIQESPVQAATVQEEDSVLYAAGNAGQTITANVTDIPFNLVSNKGNDVNWSGNSFTVNKNGIYDISGVTFYNASVARSAVLYMDGAAVKSMGTNAGISSNAFSATEYLEIGKVYSIRQTVGGTLSNDSTFHTLTITKQNSIKQVNVNPNSKITIPTSELRMEGASSRGSVDTAIVRFDNVAKLRGDAFEVISTVENGTKIVMKKKGKLDVSTTTLLAVSGTSIGISVNQSLLTAYPSNSELRAGQTVAASYLASASAQFDVNIGDVIRVPASSTPSSNGANSLNLSFQEQDIAVSVTNVLPQFSDSDSSIRLDTANGYGSVGNKIRRFANVRDNIGTDIEYIDSATDGASFVVKSDGIYNISYTDTLGIQGRAGISLNSTQLALEITGLSAEERLAMDYAEDTAGGSASCSWQGFLQKGDVVRPHTNGIASVGSVQHFTISKVGKPNVTGVDVTPFVNIPQPDSQSSFLYKPSATTSNTNVSGNLTNSNGSSIYSYDSSTGIYTLNKSCKLSLTYDLRNNAGLTVRPTIYVNDVVVSEDATQNVSTASASTSHNQKYPVGTTFYFRPQGADGVENHISVLAESTSDQIITPPEVFSTDTNTLTYAPSSLYTLSTLKDAPVGTFITFTYAANTNTRTQTTTAPTQTTADMNLNGLRIFTRAYNAASTAASPAAFAIQVGKGFKGKSIDLYKSINKVNPGSTEADSGGNSSEFMSGLGLSNYDEKSGVLYVDAGYNYSAINTTRFFRYNDLTIGTEGYLVINASKSPLKMGFGIASDTSAKLGLDPDKFITPKTLRSGLNATGEAPVYACRAWVNFNGTGTVAIRESGNVSSITDLGVGSYRVNFETPMEDVNYSVLISTLGFDSIDGYGGNSAVTTTSVGINTRNGANVNQDRGGVSVAIFR